MGIFCVSIALFIYGYDFLWTASLLWALPVSALSFVYAALRAVNYKGVKAGDFFVAAALIFTFFAPFYPFWASVALSLSLGIILMIRGHKKKRLAYFITGLFLLLLTVMAKASGSMIFSFPLLFCIFSFFAYKEYHGKGKG
jgi:hypothetical protein